MFNIIKAILGRAKKEKDQIQNTSGLNEPDRYSDIARKLFYPYPGIREGLIRIIRYCRRVMIPSGTEDIIMPNTTNRSGMPWQQKLCTANLDKVRAAVKKLRDKNNNVTYAAVSRLSGISRTTLFNNSDMNDLIMRAKYDQNGENPAQGNG